MTERVEIPHAQQREIIDFLSAFRKRCIDKWGIDRGTAKFGSYVPAILSDHLKGKSDDEIWKTLLEWADDVDQAVLTGGLIKR